MTNTLSDLICFNQTEIAHDKDNIFILDRHSTHEGTWSTLQVTSGELNLSFTDSNNNQLATHCLNCITPPFLIPPALMHTIEPITESFYAKLDFYCKPHRYFHKKYNMNAVHEDLVYCYDNYLKNANPLNILDIGCGSGRNSLFLTLMGHQVTALDIQLKQLENINHLAIFEKFKNIETIHHDLNVALPFRDHQFDFILSTVSLQFLKPERIPGLLLTLRDLTSTGGKHLMVFPVLSDRFSLPDTFTFLPESGELLKNYQDAGWSVLEYKESIGKLHRNDESGRPIQGLFAFLLVEKPW